LIAESQTGNSVTDAQAMLWHSYLGNDHKIFVNGNKEKNAVPNFK
jgi:hypothetical protein